MGISTLNHSSDCRVEYQRQDKLFTHQFSSSSSLPGAVWRSPFDHLPLHRSSECVRKGALSSLSKQGALAEAASSKLAQADGQVTIRYLHVFQKFIQTSKFRHVLIFESPVLFRWKKNRDASLADKIYILLWKQLSVSLAQKTYRTEREISLKHDINEVDLPIWHYSFL